MKLSYKLKHTAAVLSLIAAGTMASQEGMAQQNPFAASYFQTQYLANPAMVGGDNATKASAGYRKQWSGVENSPYTIYATGEYSTGDKVNVGVTLYNDKAGMFNTSSAMLTYAYYLPVTSNGGRIHFGISAGATNRNLNIKDFNGEQGDILLTEGNTIDFDGGVGIAYTDKRITIQGSFPNMVSYFKKDNEDIINRQTFFAAASYKLIFQDGDYTVEPKVAFRGMKGFDNIVDVGANVGLKQLNLFGLYHTSKNITLGAGYKLLDKLNVNAMYTTPGSVAKSYTGGSFELGLSFLIDQRK